MLSISLSFLFFFCVFVSLVAIFLWLLCYYVFVLFFFISFFFLANNLDKLFLSVRQMGPMATAGCGAHFAHLFGVSVPIND